MRHVWFLGIRAQELHVLDRLGAEKYVGAVVVSPAPFNVPFDIRRVWARPQTQH